MVALLGLEVFFERKHGFGSHNRGQGADDLLNGEEETLLLDLQVVDAGLELTTEGTDLGRGELLADLCELPIDKVELVELLLKLALGPRRGWLFGEPHAATRHGHDDQPYDEAHAHAPILAWRIRTINRLWYDSLVPMRVGLRAKLLGVTIALLAFLTAGALGTVHYYLGQQVRQQAARTLATASHVLASIFERTQEQLLGRGRLLVELPSLRAALTATPTDLEPLLQEVKSLRVANLLWATDAHGVVLASTGEYPALGTSLAQSLLIAQAVKGEKALGFDLFLDEWWLVMALPVMRENSGDVIGTATLALLIGEAYLARLGELVGTEVGFRWNEQHVWSQGWPAAVRGQVITQARSVVPGEPQELRETGGHRHLWSVQPMTIGIHPMVTRPLAIVGVQLDETVLHQTARAIGWVALGVLLMGTLILVGAIRSIIRPLKALVQDTQRVGRGELAHRATVHGADEVAELARSFNEMLEHLHQSQDELVQAKRYIESVIQRITNSLVVADTGGLIHIVNPATLELLGYDEAELIGAPLTKLFGEGPLRALEGERWEAFLRAGTLRNAEAVYRSKHGKLIPVLFSSAVMRDDHDQLHGIVCVAQDITERKYLERLKDEFLSTVTHELRTPLTSIAQGVSMLLDGTLGEINEDQRIFLTLTQKETKRLHRLIETVLDLSMLESGTLVLDRKPLDFTEAIDAAWKIYQPIAGNRTFVRRIAETPPADADRARIVQVLGHLFSNAIQFTSEDGTITVTVTPQDGRVTVSVADNGVGIPKEEAGRLFQKFVQIGRAEEERPGGTGLGLVFCKRMIELHGGTIQATSDVGHGATFTFTLPT